MAPSTLVEARDELLARDLIAHETRFTRCFPCYHPASTVPVSRAKV